MNQPYLRPHILLLVGLFFSEMTAADQQNGMLSAPASAQASWLVTCEPEGKISSARLAFQIEGLTKGRKFTVEATALKDGVSASTTDFKAADKKPSAFGYDIAGDGVYVVTISKVVTAGPSNTAKLKGNMLYALTAHCESATGFHTRTSIRRG